ncbi:MAG: hypothetical protein A2381_19395 [Bdellovibrionales bacterium RIFOXYB1_FULL_37_110]|nr:MAG: hypothetical protein A2381_19395 [Bdellovibrionales bacterium RIFOXYB1_FULL_37_110]
MKQDNSYGEVVTRHLVKYPNCNATENLFGGQLLAWLDETAAIFASQYMEEDLIVTKNFGSLEFKVPTELNRVINIYIKIVKEGKTSLTVQATATKQMMGSNVEIEVAALEIVFVAVNKDMTKKIWKPERFL